MSDSENNFFVGRLARHRPTSAIGLITNCGRGEDGRLQFTLGADDRAASSDALSAEGIAAVDLSDLLILGPDLTPRELLAFPSAQRVETVRAMSR
jgi:hypothetical protein